MAHLHSELSSMIRKDNLDVIDLFSGCGGMSLGFIRAGFDIKLAVDVDSIANSQYEKNLQITPEELNLFETDAETLMKKAGIGKGELAVLTGCPPCQGFTSLRNRKKCYTTNSLVIRMAELSVEIFPKIIVFENVSGILHLGSKEFAKYRKILTNAGYETKFKVLQSADYGVPQLRKRLIAISSRIEHIERALDLPKETHMNPKKRKEDGLNDWNTVRTAIGDLPTPSNAGNSCIISNHTHTNHSEKVLRILRAIPKNGGSRKDLPKNLWLDCHKKLQSGAENVYGRMRWDTPSNTISSRCTTPACGRFIHPEQDRGITIREAMRLQTFPDSYEFSVTINAAAKLVGNAMPILLAQAIAEHVSELLQR